MGAMPDWYVLLACPKCKEPIQPQGKSLVCEACAAHYEVGLNAVWMLPGTPSDRQRLESTDGQVMVSGYRQPNRLLKALRHLISSEYFPGKAWRAAKARTLANGPNTLILGSGVTRYPNAIHLDLDDFPGVDVVADAHSLPFRDGCMDGVVCEVVLEHAAQPLRILCETQRVLKPGGRFFFVVPFVFPYHGHPADYRRWSKQGLEQDFSAFSNLEIGIMGGPCSSMVNLWSEWAYTLSGLRFPKGYTLIKGGATALLFPIKFLDALVNRFPEAHRLASTLYIAGQLE